MAQSPERSFKEGRKIIKGRVKERKRVCWRRLVRSTNASTALFPGRNKVPFLPFSLNLHLLPLHFQKIYFPFFFSFFLFSFLIDCRTLPVLPPPFPTSFRRPSSLCIFLKFFLLGEIFWGFVENFPLFCFLLSR